MGGPALQLQSYLRCRRQMTHTEWMVLLFVAAMHGEWINRNALTRLPGARGKRLRSQEVREAMLNLEAMRLVNLRTSPARIGNGTMELAQITGAGMAMAGWPELKELYS